MIGHIVVLKQTDFLFFLLLLISRNLQVIKIDQETVLMIWFI